MLHRRCFHAAMTHSTAAAAPNTTTTTTATAAKNVTPAFQLLSSNPHASGSSAQRIGRLLNRIDTPNVLLYTRRGGVPHITGDLLASHFQTLTALHTPLPDLLALLPSTMQQSRAATPSIHQYLQLQDYILYLTLRDPLISEYGASNEHSFTVMNAGGKQRVSTSEFIAAVQCMKPEIVTLMADEICSHGNTLNRIRKSVRRTLAWADQCLQALMTNTDASATVAADTQQQQQQHYKPAVILASVQGTQDTKQFEYCLNELSKRQALDGYVLQRAEDAASQLIEQNKLRVLTGIGSPQDLLNGVASGIDLFEASYPYTLTQLGYAFVLPLDVAGANNSNERLSTTKLSLRAKQFELDERPLLEGCECYTCTNHKRAYVHHLLNVHELVGDILLALHNVHHYLRFVETIRQKLDDGSFAAYRERMLTAILGAPN